MATESHRFIVQTLNPSVNPGDKKKKDLYEIPLIYMCAEASKLSDRKTRQRFYEHFLLTSRRIIITDLIKVNSFKP